MSKYFLIATTFIFFVFSQPSIQYAQNLDATNTPLSTDSFVLSNPSTDHDRYENLWAAINFGNYPGFDSGNFIKSCP